MTTATLPAVTLNLRTKVTSLVALILIVPAAVATGSLTSGPAAAAEPTVRRDDPDHRARHPAHRGRSFAEPRVRRGLGDCRREHLHPDGHPDHGSRPALGVPRAGRDLKDRVGGAATNLQWDTLVTDLHDRGVVEGLLADPVAGPSDQAKAMITGEAAGINKWLSTHEITDPACADQTWIKPDVTDAPTSGTPSTWPS